MDPGPSVLSAAASSRRSHRRIRVVVAKIGLDGHEVGARVVARALMEAGMEVIYTGLRRTPEQVAATVLDEDADVVGISILSGAHVPLLRRLTDLLRAQESRDVLVIVGGVIPDADVPTLEALGVHRVFHPASTGDEIIAFVRERARR